jgi:hypothetical protein
METIVGYDEYISKLLKYISENNGKHNINKIKAKEWVNAQPKEVQHIASKLIDITVYIPFEKIKNQMEKLVLDKYKIIQNDPNNEIHMYTGEKDMSNYFLSMLGLYYIKKHKLREPTYFFTQKPLAVKTLEKSSKNPVLIYFDDMAYSGGQLVHLIQYITFNIYMNVCLENTKHLEINRANFFEKIKELNNTDENNNIRNKIFNQLENYKYYDIKFLLLGINNLSKARLDEIYDNCNIFKSFANIINFKDILPFTVKCSYDWAVKYNTIDYYLTDKEIFLLCYYFSVGRVPPVAMYYDHNIAANTSTFQMIYNYGIVVPINYDISHYWKYFINIVKDKVNSVIQKNNKLSEFSKKFYDLSNKYYKDVKTNKFEDINKPIKFIPFINNCKNLDEIIKNPLLKSVNYILLILITHQGNININDKFSNSPLLTHQNILNNFYGNNETKKKILDFLESITDHKCKFAFYKSWLINNNMKSKKQKASIKNKTKLTKKNNKT